MTKIGVYIEDVIKRWYEQHITFQRAMTILIFHKLKKMEILPTELNFANFDRCFQLKFDETGEMSSFELDNEALRIKIDKDVGTSLSITSEDVQETVTIIQESVNEGVEKIIELFGENLAESWIKRAPFVLQEEKNEFLAFLVKLQEIWGEVLELLDILLSTALDKGVSFNETHGPSVSPNAAPVFLVANYLFGRACQVGREIHILLSNGFADGAEARWRTLHEIVVVATFIMRRGREIAERYIAHETIDTFETMKNYMKYWKPEGIEIITDEEFQDIKKKWDALIEAYGKAFGGNYGWAAKALGKNDKQNVTFLDIEQAVGLDYLRPAYKEANSNIHASSRGTAIRLGLPNTPNKILAGYSLFGIGEVARNTASSMLILSENFLMSYPDVENRVHIQATYKLLDKISNALVKAEKTLSERQTGNKD